MKKTRWIAGLLIVALMVVLSGCSLFAGTSGDKQQDSAAAGAIKITDEYTFTDPEGLDFDTRCVYYDADGTMSAGYKEQGYDVVNMFVIIYGKDDKPVMEYDYFVFADDAALQTFLANSPNAAGQAESEGNVMWITSDADTLEANMIIYQSYNIVSDTSMASLEGLYKDMYAMTAYTGE